MGVTNTFLRVEKKFVLTRSQAMELKRRMSDHIAPDSYPEYDLYNIYFDTVNHDIVSKCLGKSAYKEKIRLRSYTPCGLDDMAFLEIKRKHNGLGEKRRVDITPFNALKAIRNKTLASGDTQIEREINFFLKRYDLVPTMFITYHRTAYSGTTEKDLRVTFDDDIRFRTRNLSMRPTGEEISFTGKDTVVTEIKVCGRFPLWLSHILTDMNIHEQSFSKYGKIYTAINATGLGIGDLVALSAGN